MAVSRREADVAPTRDPEVARPVPGESRGDQGVDDRRQRVGHERSHRGADDSEARNEDQVEEDVRDQGADAHGRGQARPSEPGDVARQHLADGDRHDPGQQDVERGQRRLEAGQEQRDGDRRDGHEGERDRARQEQGDPRHHRDLPIRIRSWRTCDVREEERRHGVREEIHDLGHRDGHAVEAQRCRRLGHEPGQQVDVDARGNEPTERSGIERQPLPEQASDRDGRSSRDPPDDEPRASPGTRSR